MDKVIVKKEDEKKVESKEPKTLKVQILHRLTKKPQKIIVMDADIANDLIKRKRAKIVK